MIKSFFNKAFHQILKEKPYSLINIGGLSIGLACTILISGYVIFELSYDRQYPNFKQIYRLYVDGIWSNKSLREGRTSYQLADALKSDFPQVDRTTRCLDYGNRSIHIGEKHFCEDQFFYADSNFVDFFDYKVLQGDPGKMLRDPFSIVITKSAAKRYFGNADPINKTLNIENNFGNDTATYEITGVIEDLPDNSHLKIAMLASICTLPEEGQKNWLGGSYFTYMQVVKNTDHLQLDTKLANFTANYIAPELQQFLGLSLAEYLASENRYQFHLQPVTDIHLNSEIGDGLTIHGNARQVYILACIAAFILILACVNFTNLSTAKALTRAKEIAIRKISGASKVQIACQFLGETFLQILIAFILAVIIVKILISPFSQLMDRKILFDYTDPGLLAGMLILILGTTALAGGYPVFVISSFNPVVIIKGKPVHVRRRISLKTSLVILQLFLSMCTAICTITIYRQMVYMEKKELGYNRADLMIVERIGPIRSRLESFLQEISRIPEVSSAAMSSGIFGRGLYENNYSMEGKNPNDQIFVKYMSVNYDFANVYGLHLNGGRWFSKEFTDLRSLVINEAAAKQLGWSDPVGKRLYITTGNDDRIYSTIIGVVKDFHFESLHEPIKPFAFYLNPVYNEGFISILFKKSDLNVGLASVKKVWDSFAPNNPMFSFFYDQEFDRMYRSEISTGKIMLVFTILAIVIASMGLLGMVSYSVERRTREVGVRKSLGASSNSILFMFLRNFIIVVIIANIIAWPLAWYGVNTWLNDFAFRISLNADTLVAVTAGALIICFITVGYQTFRIAWSNPIDSLRYE